MTPHTLHSPSQTRLPMAQSQMSHYIKTFIAGVVTEKQFELVPLRRDPQQKSTWAFISSQSTQAQVSRSLVPAPVFLFIHLAGVTGLSFPLLSKRLAISSFCCVSQCPFTWLVSPTFVPFVIPEVASSQPLVLGWSPELNWHFSLCFESSCLD